jgi:hypothetical protein
MTETKKTRTRGAKSAPKADLIELAAAPVAAIEEVAQAAEPAPAPLSSKSKKEGEPFAFSLNDQSETMHQAVREAVAASAKGALEVNDKFIQALHIQGDAAINLWRTSIDNARLPDGLNAQTGAARQAFEATSAQWKDVAETTARWISKSIEPLQSALRRQTR